MSGMVWIALVVYSCFNYDILYHKLSPWELPADSALAMASGAKCSTMDLSFSFPTLLPSQRWL